MKNIIHITLTIILITISTLNTPNLSAQDNDTHESIMLPDNAAARLGKGRIYDMQYTEDGTRLAVATSIGIWLYDTIDFREVYLLKGHQKYAEFMAFSPDGKTLASAENSGTVILWDTETGVPELEFKSSGGAINIIFSDDGDTIGILGADGSFRLWDPDTAEEKQTFEDIIDFRVHGIFSIAFNPNDFMIATGHDNGKVSITDPFTGDNIHTLEGHEDFASTLGFSADGSLIASGHWQNIHIWDTDSGELKLHLDEYVGIDNLTFSPDGSLLASNSGYGDIILLDTNTGEQRKVLKGHSGQGLRIAFSSDLRTLASASVDGSVRIWNVFTGQEIHNFANHFGNFTCFDISADGKTVVAPTYDLTVCLWDLESANLDTTFDKEGYFGVAEIAFNPSDTIIATASYGNFISVWNRETGEQMHTLKGHEDDVTTAVFSPDGKTLATGSWDRTIRIWDVDTGKQLRMWEAHNNILNQIVFSPDGTTLASASDDMTVRLWDPKTGTQKQVLKGHESKVSSVAYSPDGTTLASADKTKSIRLWNATTGEFTRNLDVDASDAVCIAFSPDSSVLAVGKQSGDVQLIEVGTGESLHQFIGHLNAVTEIAFTPDGTQVVSRCDDGILYVWNAN